MKKKLYPLLLIVFLSLKMGNSQNLEIVILGIAQDAGYPQANCLKTCCVKARSSSEQKVMVSSLGLIDLETNEYFLIDCSPDFKDQLHAMSNYVVERGQLPSGILLTHAHIGHYFGLAQLGKEVIGASKVPVYAMPKMKKFLRSNGPWSQLVKEGNIDLKPLKHQISTQLTPSLSITPIRVPHRDEYSETVGFIVKGKEESLLYIPDIDKWERWDMDIAGLIKQVDHAFLDGTFYDNGELPNRDMSQIPHPFVAESMKRFETLSALERSKIHFIHLNHTNPLLDRKSLAYKKVYLNGYNVASQGLSIYMD